MLKVRIIPLLLLKGASLVKSVRFDEHRIVGDAVSAIKVFSKRFADEMVILDLDARERGYLNCDLLERITTFCNMPLAIGGGINSVEKADAAFRAGADKIVVNTVFFERPQIVETLAKLYGSQSVCLSLDVKGVGRTYKVFSKNGTSLEGSVCLENALGKAEAMGVGEVLVNDINRDGVMSGLDLSLVKLCRSNTSLPLISAGGIGSKNDFLDGFDQGADALCAGSVFHWVGESVLGVKGFLAERGVPVRTI